MFAFEDFVWFLFAWLHAHFVCRISKLSIPWSPYADLCLNKEFLHPAQPHSILIILQNIMLSKIHFTIICVHTVNFHVRIANLYYWLGLMTVVAAAQHYERGPLVQNLWRPSYYEIHKYRNTIFWTFGKILQNHVKFWWSLNVLLQQCQH